MSRLRYTLIVIMAVLVIVIGLLAPLGMEVR